MNSNNLSKAIPIRLTQEQAKAFENLTRIGFNKSKLIRLAIDEYLHKNYRKFITENKRIKTPF